MPNFLAEVIQKFNAPIKAFFFQAKAATGRKIPMEDMVERRSCIRIQDAISVVIALSVVILKNCFNAEIMLHIAAKRSLAHL